MPPSPGAAVAATLEMGMRNSPKRSLLPCNSLKDAGLRQKHLFSLGMVFGTTCFCRWGAPHPVSLLSDSHGRVPDHLVRILNRVTPLGPKTLKVSAEKKNELFQDVARKATRATPVWV